MKLNWFTCLQLIALIIIANSCTTNTKTYNISSEDFHHNFSKYQTYAWIPYDYTFCQKTGAAIYQGICNNPWYERLLRDEVNEYLYIAGLRVSPTNPDLLITYKIVFKDITLDELIAYNNEAENFRLYPPGNFNNYSSYNKITGHYTIQPDNYIYEPGGNIFHPEPDFNSYPHYAPPLLGYSFETLLSEGTLVLEVIDRKNNFIVWAGWSKETINGPVDFRLKLEPIIHQMMKRFPGLNY
ncbi:MAG TPA: DUF4136 domain-containing protein [Cytophagaceae bacterium]